MLLSEFLQNRVDRSRAVLYTLTTPGWRMITEEQIDRLEFQAFKGFKNLAITQAMDVESHRQLLELQMQAKFAEIFRNIGKTYTDQLEADIALLMLITNGWEEDVEVPEEGPKPTETIMEAFKSQLKRIGQEIAKHVNV